MQFIKSMATPRTSSADFAKNVKTLTLAEVEKIIVDKDPPATLCEYIHGDKFVVPYFDSDNYYEEWPDTDEYDRILGCFGDNIATIMKDQEAFLRDSIIFASRHGVSPCHPDKVKLSYRGYIPGWKIRVRDLGRLIESSDVKGESDGRLDITLYKKKDQLLATILCKKGFIPNKGDDDRVLEPVGDAPFESYIVQNLKGDEKEIVTNFVEPVVRKSSKLTKIVKKEEEPPSSSGEPPRERIETDENIYRLLELLSLDRWKNYKDWRNIGFALIHEADDHFDDTFVKFSRNYDRFDEAEVRDHLRRWRDSTYAGEPITIRSLHTWAKVDSPITYDSEIPDCSFARKLEECITTNGAPHRMGELFAIKYGDVIKCTDAKKQSFYAFENHRWKSAGLSKVSMILSRQFYMIFINHSRKIGADVALAVDDDDKNRLELRRTATNKLAGGLLNPKCKSSIISEIANILLDESFRKSLDSKVELLGFDNGIYDLMRGEFRKGQPEDRVSISCGYDYDASMNEAVHDQVLGVITSCFASADMAQYFIDILSLCLYGHKRFEELWVWTGKGSNGKSSMADLLKSTFGQYFATIDSTFFTRPSAKSNEPTPELANKSAVRFLLSSEPESSEKLQIAKLKIFTGGDTITARNLYEAPFSYKPQFGIFIQTNEIPELSKLDGGIQRRLRVVNFPFKFTSNPMTPLEKLSNPSLKEDKFHRLDWRQQLMNFLIDNFTRRLKNATTLSTPAEVMRATNDYFDSNNNVIDWLHAHYDITGNPADQIRAQLLYNTYKIDKVTDLLDIKKFRSQMLFSGISADTDSKGAYWSGLKRKDDIE